MPKKETYEGRWRKSLLGPLHKQMPIDNEFKNNRTSNRTDSRLMQKGLSDVFILFYFDCSIGKAFSVENFAGCDK